MKNRSDELLSESVSSPPSAAKPAAELAQPIAPPAGANATPVELPAEIAGQPATGAAAKGDLTICSLFAPPEIPRGDSILLQVFLHLPAVAAEIERQAGEADPSATRRGSNSLEVPIERGTRVHLHLDVPKLSVADPIQSLIWQGQAASRQFQLSAPAELAATSVLGKLTLSVDSVPIGHVTFRLGVSTAGATTAPQRLGNQARVYKLVFISYASADRPEVLKRVQMMSVFDVDFFQDILHLEPGERWERKLYEKIDQCDLFLLFWSKAAKDSEWVMKEARRAIDRKHGDEGTPPEIIPVILEGPPPVPPPDDLKSLHFNDPLLYLMQPPREPHG